MKQTHTLKLENGKLYLDNFQLESVKEFIITSSSDTVTELALVLNVKLNEIESVQKQLRH